MTAGPANRSASTVPAAPAAPPAPPVAGAEPPGGHVRAGRLRGRVPELFRERLFRRFWSGQAISAIGDQVTMIALPLVAVLALDADAAQMGYLTAAALLPNLLLALHAGVWVDRRARRRQIMIMADVGRACLLASVPVAYALDALTLGQLYAVAFLAETLAVLFVVSAATLFVSIVPRDRFVQGNALLYGSHAFAAIGGQSVGGLLVQLITAPLALLADAVSFLVSAVFLGRIRPAEPPADGERGGLAAGLRFIRDSAIIRASLAATTTLNLFNFMFHALFVLFATQELHVRPAVLGVALGVGAVGTLIGSALAGRIAGRFGVGPVYTAACVAFPAPLVLVPLADGSPALVFCMLLLAEFGSGFGVALLDITGGSIKAAIVPDRVRARVTGAYRWVNYGVRPVGALLGGLLGTAIGVRPTLWIATLGAIAGTLWLLPSPVLRLRHLPGHDPAPR